MPEIRALFWDIGGVLLTNAWDHDERALAFEHFRLQREEFEQRHKQVVEVFEQGRITLDEYLQQTVFYEPRDFRTEEFKQFLFSLSKPKSDTLEIARRLAPKYFIGTINNESRELNQYRIEKFGLGDIFKLFVSSCFVGLRKPDERIYRMALDLTHRTAEECVFIDDRQPNVEAALKVGMRGIVAPQADQLLRELADLGVSP